MEGLQGKKGKEKNGVIIISKKIRKRKCNISNHTVKLFLEFKSMNATSLTLVSQIQHNRLFEPDNFGRKKNGLTCSL